MSDKLRKYKSLYSSTSNTFSTGESVTITPASVVGLPTDTEITLTFDRVDSSGQKTPDKMERIRGTITGSNFVISASGRAVEGTEQVHTSPVVEMVWNADDWNDSIDAFLEEHGQDGKHTNALVTTLKASGAEIDTGTDDDKIVTPKALADSDYAKTSDITVTADSTTTFTNKTLTSPLFQGSIDGWVSANETWEHVSVDDPTGIFRVNADVTTKYSAGMRIKFTNGGNVIYGIITVVGAYSGGYTSITFLHQIDPADNLALYLMANSDITVNYYSTQKAPQGFPLDPDKWSVKVVDTTDRSETTTNSNVFVNLGGSSGQLSVPIGLWTLSWYAVSGAAFTTPTYVHIKAAMSTSSDTANDTELMASFSFIPPTANSDIRIPMGKTKAVSLSSKTLYYLIICRSGAQAVTNINFYNSSSPSIMRAICAYL
jgi:hypothetical protein